LWFENQKAKNLNRKGAKSAKSAKKIKSNGASCKTIVIPEGFYPGSRFLVSYEMSFYICGSLENSKTCHTDKLRIKSDLEFKYL